MGQNVNPTESAKGRDPGRQDAGRPATAPGQQNRPHDPAGRRPQDDPDASRSTEATKAPGESGQGCGCPEPPNRGADGKADETFEDPAAESPDSARPR